MKIGVVCCFASRGSWFLILQPQLVSKTIVIVSGGAKGADALGEKYAEENGLEIERYFADWNTFGKSAGPKRNELMAQSSDYIICFWDGKSRGTKSMIDFAQKYNTPIKIKYI